MLLSHIANVAIGSSHDCWFIALCHVVNVDVGFTFHNTNNVNGVTFSLSHYWCYYWFVALLVMFIALLGTCMNHSPYRCFFALSLCVASWYSHYKWFVEVLPPLPSPCKWSIGCPSCCTFPTNKCSPLPFPLCVANLLCYMVRFYPCPLPCLGGEVLLQWKTKGIKFFFFVIYIYYFLSFCFLFSISFSFLKFILKVYCWFV